jgi:hypothetical protein
MFRVRWERKALKALAEAWTKADSELRRRITQASSQIDGLLRTNPQNQGESRPKGRRIMFVGPLAVRYRIEADHQTVSVLHVWAFTLPRG